MKTPGGEGGLVSPPPTCGMRKVSQFRSLEEEMVQLTWPHLPEHPSSSICCWLTSVCLLSTGKSLLGIAFLDNGPLALSFDLEPLSLCESTASHSCLFTHPGQWDASDSARPGLLSLLSHGKLQVDLLLTLNFSHLTCTVSR